MEMIKVLEEIQTDCAYHVAEPIDHQVDQDFHDIEERKYKALTSAIKDLQAYEQLKERLDAKQIYSDLLARHNIFFDYQEGRISIGKFRELLAQSIVNFLKEEL